MHPQPHAIETLPALQNLRMFRLQPEQQFNLPALLSLELVYGRQNLTETTGRFEVQKTFHLQRTEARISSTENNTTLYCPFLRTCVEIRRNFL